ncbi:hypothetical protein LshimejAT787_0207420 [Lyophyllum shimeji]|uniref:RING-type domain-containing protein n=1 Tax=Lyophyllum shimeji TaxID=47721 RepID=A0A9P3PGX1_LYOSH|nr:hypothetical protein LshimejAT787_0207420 [Lyophyllum shimeji]
MSKSSTTQRSTFANIVTTDVHTMNTHLLRCQICLNLHPVLQFKFFPCGHGFCTACIENIFSHNPKCPHCRVTLRRREAHVVYIDIPSPEEERAAKVETLVEGFAQMDRNSKLISVENAGKKLNAFVKEVEGGQDTYSSLLQAVEDFKERIIPAFRKAEEQAKEIETLKKKLEVCQHDLAGSVSRVKPLEKELGKMRSNLCQVEQERDQAIGLAEQASQETIRLRQRLARTEQEVHDLQAETKRYKEHLLQQANIARSQNKKIERLKKDSNKSKAQPTQENARSEVVLESEKSVTQSYDACEVDLEMPLTPSSSLERPLSTHANNVRHDFEAMPPPGGFRSDWQLPDKFSKKRKRDSENGRTDGFPLSLDTKGRPLRTVQLGTRRTLRAPLR